MTGAKNPSSIFYWNDLENDEKLKTCSLAAKGLWTCHLLPIAARSTLTGVIIIGSWPCRVSGDLPTVLANMVGGSPDVIGVLLGELINSGAASVDEEGRLYNRRMVRERQISEARKAAGKKGAARRWENVGDGNIMAKGMAKGVAKSEAAAQPQLFEEQREIGASRQDDGCEGDGKPMPSSFLHDSKKEVTTTDRIESFTAPAGAGADERGEPIGGSKAGSRKARAEARGSRLPDGWQPSPEAEQFARSCGLDPASVTPEFIDHWRSVPGNKGRKLDWDATYRNRCRQILEWRKPNGAKRTRNGEQPDEDPVAAGIRESLARRHLLARG